MSTATSVRWLVLTAVALTGAVLIIRTTSAISNWDLGTSGLEAPSVLGVYRVCMARDLYVPLSANPSPIIYNFLFYELYGLLSRVSADCEILSLLVLKVVSLALYLTAGISLSLATRERGYLVPLAVLALFSSPVIGWWLYAIRPDALALLCFTLSMLALFRFLERSTGTKGSAEEIWLVMSAVSFALAWASKQNYGVLALATSISLAADGIKVAGRWAFYTATTGLALFLVGLQVFGSPYVDHTIWINTNIPFSMAQAAQVLWLFLKKTSFFFFVCLAISIVVVTLSISSRARLLIPQTKLWGDAWKPVIRDKAAVVFSSMLLLSFVLCAAAAGKYGSSDNYFYPILPISILLMFCVGRYQIWRIELRNLLLVAMSLSLISGSAMVVLGLAGSLSLNRERHVGLLKKIQDLTNQFPGRGFILAEWGELPWFSKSTDPIVLDPAICRYTTTNKHFRIRSIEDMIRANEFSYLLVFANNNCVNVAASLVGKWISSEDGGVIAYTRPASD